MSCGHTRFARRTSRSIYLHPHRGRIAGSAKVTSWATGAELKQFEAIEDLGQVLAGRWEFVRERARGRLQQGGGRRVVEAVAVQRSHSCCIPNPKRIRGFFIKKKPPLQTLKIATSTVEPLYRAASMVCSSWPS